MCNIISNSCFPRTSSTKPVVNDYCMHKRDDFYCEQKAEDNIFCRKVVRDKKLKYLPPYYHQPSPVFLVIIINPT